MDPATARRLADLNREFYQTFAGEFSGTRQRLQPGVRKILSGLGGSEQILDLGCGNGQVARSLTRVGFNGSYLGLDYAPALLKIAGAGLLNSDKMRARLQPWASAGLTDSAVDEQDYLLDWRGSGPQHGLRYVHHLSESELAALAERSDFEIRETFYSAGQGGQLGLYQVWG